MPEPTAPDIPQPAPAATEAPPDELDLPGLLGEQINQRFERARGKPEDGIWTDPQSGWNGIKLGMYSLPPSDMKPVTGALSMDSFVFTEIVPDGGGVKLIRQPREKGGSNWSFTTTEYRKPGEKKRTLGLSRATSF